MRRYVRLRVVSAESKSAAVSVAIFVAAFAVLQVAVIASRGSDIERAFVHALSSRPVSAMLAAFGAPDPPKAEGKRLLGSTRTLTIEAGCDGAETLALLIAAIAALRLPMGRALKFLCLGGAAVLILNQFRVAALWWALGTSPRLFDLIHSQIAPAILMSSVGLIVLLATRLAPRQQPA